MKNKNHPPIIDQVIYNFKGNTSQHIDVVPIANRLLTNVNKTRTTAPHRTSFYRVIWFQEGNPIHTVDFQKIKIKSPCLLFVHKDKIHMFDKDTMHDGKVLIFTDDFLFRTERDAKFLASAKIFNGIEKPILLSKIDVRLKYLFNSIEQELQNNDTVFKGDVLYHLLNSFLYSAERALSIEHPKLFNNSAGTTLVNSFLELLDKNYKKRFSMEKYAALLNVTTNKLNQAINEVKGKTGKQIVTERLLLEAKRLLAYSDLNIKETGFALGFKEPTNFVKFFQSNTKQTPVQFQKTDK